MDGNVKIVFEPGCFDEFEGTQEELDELVAEIMRMAESGELFKQGQAISEIDLEDLPDDVVEWLSDGLATEEDLEERRKRLN